MHRLSFNPILWAFLIFFITFCYFRFYSNVSLICFKIKLPLMPTRRCHSNDSYNARAPSGIDHYVN